MKTKNTQAIVLRAGLALSLLVGVGFNTEQVSAAEQVDASVQENALSEIISEEVDAIGEKVSADEEAPKEVDEAERNPKEILEASEIYPEDKSEESTDLEDIHSNDSLTDEEIETPEQADQETPADEEQPVADEVVEMETDKEIIEEEPEEESIEELEDEPIEEAEEMTTAEDKEKSEKKDSPDTEATPAAMTMSSAANHSSEEVKVERVYGQNRFKNAVEISKKGWSAAPKVFIANGHKFADALTGSPLAALNNAPILLTRENTLPSETLAELYRLNTKEVVILGGELSVSTQIVSALQKNGFKVMRIGGNNRYTQAELVANEIMKVEGKNRDAFLASGQVFSDALNIATVASNKRLPIYLTRGSHLDQSILRAIPYVNSWTIIGGELTINQSVETEMENAGAKTSRIDGQNRYEVNRNILSYYGVPKDHLYVTSGEHYSDTLPASVLASKEKSGVLLLRNNRPQTNDEQKFFAQSKHGIRNFTMIGGPLTLSEETKSDFENLLRTADNNLLNAIAQQFSQYTLSEYNIRLNDALAMQMGLGAKPQTDKKYTAFVNKHYINRSNNTVTANLLNVRSGAGTNNHVMAQLRQGSTVNILREVGDWYQIDLRQYWVNASPEDVEYYLNPNNFVLSEKQMVQFLDLTQTTGATAEQLNSYLAGKGILHGTGQAFIDAGKKHGVNEIYLLSHALLETGHGTSTLAKGVQLNGNKVYNVFGIGAFDSDPVGYGSLRALEEKWFTPEAAIIGGAAFIGNNYVKAGQNTLYKMRWNPTSMANNGYATHQYATDIGWASKQVNTIYNLYHSIGIGLNHVEIPVYLA